MPLLLVSKNGELGLANPDAEVKHQLEWSGERDLRDVFVFPAASCSFVHRNAEKVGSVACVCCYAESVVHVRLVLLGEEIVHLGTCEMPLDESGKAIDAKLMGITCSATGVFGFISASCRFVSSCPALMSPLFQIDSPGFWYAYQLSSSESSPLDAIPLAEPFRLQRLVAFKKKYAAMLGMAMVSLSSSLVLLAVTVEGDVSLQLWDLCYGALLALQTVSPPTSIDSPPFLHLALADKGHVLLTVSPSQDVGRSTVYAVPFDHALKSSLAAALGKSSASEAWLEPQKFDPQISPLDEDKRSLVTMIEGAMSKKKPQSADETFFAWIRKHHVLS